ncbi:MAG: polyphosphate polymerase domain-containing protein [Lachnospiraceae bacterium]|nr:polyphosphate polymerase domain-containing protein [Lachnospiraceae bacterium]
MEYRHEVKFPITTADAVAIRQNLTAVASVDSHAGKDGCYRIHSLYFDDQNNTALWEKLDGVNERRKFRIRYYNEDLSYIMLECKMKRDNVGCKLQQRLTQEEVLRILKGDTSWMAASGKPLLVTLYVEMKAHGLRPKCVVDYMRRPFTYAPGNVRVTIDWNIRTGSPAQFMNPNALTLPVDGNPMLMEVKWDDYLPGIIRRAVSLHGRGQSAFSKYATCRMYG